MNQDNRLLQVLEHLSDTIVVGLLTLLASLPVVTAAAALSAAAATLEDTGAGGWLAVRYLAHLRTRLRVGTQLGTAALLATVVATVDIMWATSTALDVMRTMVLAVGVLLALATAAITTAASAHLAQAPTTDLRTLVTHAAWQAAAAPQRTALPVAVAVLGAAIAAPLLFLAPVLVGVLARSLRHARSQQLDRSATPASRPASLIP